MTDDELRSMLREWEAPGAPASLRGRVLPVRRFSLRWWLSGELRVPVPVALALAACVVALGVYALMRPVLRPSSSKDASLSDFQQVQRFDPRIVRTVYEQH